VVAVDAAMVEVAIVADANNTSGQGSRLKVTWVRSGIGFAKRQKATIEALGLHRLHQTVDLPDNPAVRGQIYKVKHMVEVQES
jgi:large subunit ribosomal protein L30